MSETHYQLGRWSLSDLIAAPEGSAMDAVLADLEDAQLGIGRNEFRVLKTHVVFVRDAANGAEQRFWGASQVGGRI